jgi:hypothetical protein
MSEIIRGTAEFVEIGQPQIARSAIELKKCQRTDK